MSNEPEPPKSPEISPALFFRAFDLAFFVPGSLIVIQLLYEYRSFKPWDLLTKADQNAAQTIIFVAGLVVVSFVLGLICQSIHRSILKSTRAIRPCISALIEKMRPLFLSLYMMQNCSESPSDTVYDAEDLSRATYFWYLRSTCWNTSVALVICSIIKITLKRKFNPMQSMEYNLMFPYIIAAALLLLLGFDYHKAYLKRTTKSQKPSGTTQR